MKDIPDNSVTYKIILKDSPIAIMPQNGVDVIVCIDAFERGCKNIYLVDDLSRYSGQAITVNTFCMLWETKASIVVLVPSITYQGDGDEFSEDNKRQIINLCNMRPDLLEIPITDIDGKIVKVLNVVRRGGELISEQRLPWHNWVNWHVPLSYLLKYRTIYVSSLENSNVRDFYRYYGSCLSIELLSSDNIYDALYGENVLLVYGIDVYPNSGNKIDVMTLYNDINQQAAAIIYRELYIEHVDIAVISKQQVNNLSQIIRLFDQGHQVINVVSSVGDFYGIITERDFGSSFPSTEIPIRKDVFIPYPEDENMVKKHMIQLVNQWSELPIVLDKKLKGVGIRGKHFAGKGRKYNLDMQPLHWNLISDAVIMSFFDQKQRILLSSTAPDLKSIGDRLKDCGMDVTFFDDSLLSDYLGKKFDLLLYGSNLWSIKHIPSFDVRKLYANLLVEEIKRYMTKCGVSFYYFDIKDESAIMESCSEIVPVPTQPAVTIGGERVVYTVYADSMEGEGFHTVGGKRITVGNLENNKQAVHLFGPCTVVGTFTANDEDTIASQLQRYVNNIGLPYNVINYGNPGEKSISSLNRIMDTSMKSGDIVVLFGQDLYNEMPVFSVKPRHSLKEIFDLHKYRQGKPFFDLTPHLTPFGNHVVAEYLFQLLRDGMEKTVNQVLNPVKPFAEGLKANIICEAGLQDYLTELNVNRVKADTIGAIVMNCNPFTLGHRYLIEQALKQVEFLYVFVVEEDSSAFSFQDRFAMVKENCQDISKLLVLPSGSYMISRITFSAYFSKDELQEQTIIPAMDVRLFGEYIAPCLGIKKRFVGEEPLDNVTRQYNEAMKVILPDYGVELVEIPRLVDLSQNPINATQVRENIIKGKLEECRSYLTDVTYQYIEHNYKRIRQRLINMQHNQLQNSGDDFINEQ